MANEIVVTDQKIKGWLVDNQAELTGYAARRPNGGTDGN